MKKVLKTMNEDKVQINQSESSVTLKNWLYRLLGFEKRKVERLRIEKERQDEIDLEKAEMKFTDEFAKRGDKIKYLGKEVTVTGYHHSTIIGLEFIRRKYFAGLWVEWFNDIGEHQRKFIPYLKLQYCEKAKQAS